MRSGYCLKNLGRYPSRSRLGLRFATTALKPLPTTYRIKDLNSSYEVENYHLYARGAYGAGELLSNSKDDKSDPSPTADKPENDDSKPEQIEDKESEIKKDEKEEGERQGDEESEMTTESESATVSESGSISEGSSAGAPGAPANGGNPPAPPAGGAPPNGGSPPNKDTATGLYPPLLAIPMKDRPPLPGRPFAINITDSEVIRSIYTIIDRREPYFVLFHVKDQGEADTDIIKDKESVYDIGVHCQIIRHNTLRPGVFNVLAYPLERCQLEDLNSPRDTRKSESEIKKDELEESPTSYLKNLKVSYATVKPIKEDPFDKSSTEIKSLVEALKTLLSKMGGKNPLQKLQIKEITDLVNDPARFADFVGSTIHGDPKKIQEILEALNVETRLSKALELLKIEIKANSIKESTIHNLSSKADEHQTRLFIKEFIRELQKRAGLSESEDKKTQKYDERLANLKMTEEALEAYYAEKSKIENQSEHSSEVGVSERYLDWLTSIPWGIYSKDRFNVKQAREILDRDHYGLKDVKDRILEFISMGRVSGKVDGKILCLAGPPGTGKTSIAKSIAETLDRKYVRIAMGGIQDVHEVKGHRRTYVGSIPGRIISALKQAKTSNPLMLIDEIDKLDLSRSGGAASAFLEILDPEQNNAFVDNYIDVKVDLSKVLFVCTANYLGNIPAPLRDRMEIIDVPGYTNNEKIEIAKRHLIPDATKKAGLDEGKVVIKDESIAKLIEKYCRESGLRNIKKLITRIISKVSLKIVEQVEGLEEKAAKSAPQALKSADSEEAKQVEKAESSESSTVDKETTKTASSVSEESSATGEAEDEAQEKSDKENKVEEDEEPLKLKIPDSIKLEITPDNLKDFVGPEIYTRDRVYDIPPPGVATGLSYSSSGNGDALYIESILTNSIGSGTGHAGVNVTGSLKDVMKESSSIAYSFAKSYMVKKFPENRFFESADIHLHCPDGAIPKDGPSAGIAFTSSLISLALNQSLPPSIAMTGEITVTGRVLAVGGLREKTLGAKRYGCDTIIFPKDIENELEEIPEEVKEGIRFIPVEWYDDVFNVIFPSISKEQGNSVWKDEFAKLDSKKKEKKK